MFDATFGKVRTVIDRTVNQEGRIPRMSEYKGHRVAVVILENSAPEIEGTISYGGGMMQRSEIDYGVPLQQSESGQYDYGSNPTTKEIMEATQ
jgi:hypothetical protein